jgi:hypothetical protein
MHAAALAMVESIQNAARAAVPGWSAFDGHRPVRGGTSARVLQVVLASIADEYSLHYVAVGRDEGVQPGAAHVPARGWRMAGVVQQVVGPFLASSGGQHTPANGILILTAALTLIPVHTSDHQRPRLMVGLGRRLRTARERGGFLGAALGHQQTIRLRAVPTASITDVAFRLEHSRRAPASSGSRE